MSVKGSLKSKSTKQCPVPHSWTELNNIAMWYYNSSLSVSFLYHGRKSLLMTVWGGGGGGRLLKHRENSNSSSQHFYYHPKSVRKKLKATIATVLLLCAMLPIYSNRSNRPNYGWTIPRSMLNDNNIHFFLKKKKEWQFEQSFSFCLWQVAMV